MAKDRKWLGRRPAFRGWKPVRPVCRYDCFAPLSRRWAIDRRLFLVQNVEEWRVRVGYDRVPQPISPEGSVL